MAKVSSRPAPQSLPASKLRHSSLPENLRVLMPEDEASGPLVLHKDAFSWGGQAQLFAGFFAGRPVVVRRLNALPPRAAAGLRAVLADSRGGRQDTMAARLIDQDVQVTRQVAKGRGRAFAALSTRREPGGEVGKVFEIIEPMQADLLGVVHALASQPLPVRQAVAAVCIGRIAADLATWHKVGIAHGDVRAENLLLRTHQDGGIWVEGHDFGHASAASQDGDLLLAATRNDVRNLGRVALMLLQPAVRAQVAGAHLPASVARVCAEVPSWAPLLQDMLADRPTGMAEVAQRLQLPEAQAAPMQRLAFSVLHQVRHKADDIASCLGEIVPWMASLLGPAAAAALIPPGGPAAANLLVPLPPATWAEIAEKLRGLAI